MAIGNKLNYYTEFLTVPLAAVGCLLLTPIGGAAQVSALVVGYLLWVLAEYWMHRELFHHRYRKQHWVHHLKPTSEDGSPPTLHAHLCLALAVLALHGALGGAYLGNPASAGLLLGYLSYIVPHHGLHRSWFGSPGWVRRHQIHHAGVEKNFNVLCPLGDLIFGTYQPAPKVTKR